MEKKIEEQKQIIENRLIESIKNKENVTKERMEEAEKINPPQINSNELALENTANYKKFDAEIRKTNEFIAALKELQKKLD